MAKDQPQSGAHADRCRPQQRMLPARPETQRCADVPRGAAGKHAAAIEPREPADHGEHRGGQPHNREQRHLAQPRKRRRSQRDIGNRTGAQRQPQRGQQAAHQTMGRALGCALARSEIVNAVVFGHAHQTCAKHQREQVHLAKDQRRHAERHRAAHQQRQAYQHHRQHRTKRQPRQQQHARQRAPADHIDFGIRLHGSGLGVQRHTGHQHPRIGPLFLHLGQRILDR